MKTFIRESLLAILFFTAPVYAEEGRVYLKNGNIFDGDISFSEAGTVSVKLLKGKLVFEPRHIERIIYCGAPAPLNEKFLESLRESLLSPVHASRYDAAISAIAREKGLDPSLVKAVMKVESNFKPYALSYKGAIGLMQLMPSTARLLGVDPFDPVENLKGGSEYLRQMMLRFDGNLVLALSAYNAGPLAVEKYGTIPPYSETRYYVKHVLEYRKKFQKPVNFANIVLTAKPPARRSKKRF